jgi:hypothetical protein
MAATHLIAVSDNTAPQAVGEAPELDRVETGVQRVRHLQQQARALAREQVEILACDLHALAARSEDISESGDAYPAGVRELVSRIAEDLAQHVHVLRGILYRTGQA